MTTLITMEHVVFGYHEMPLVTDVSLAIGAGEVVRLDGPNGSGKSTLMKLIAGHLRPASGRILVGGHSAESHPARRSRWFMESEPLLYGYLTVTEQLHFYSRLQGADPRAVVETAVRLGLGDHRDALGSTLSSGQRRKVWFAVAMSGHTCPVLLLDEPFNEVDSTTVPSMIKMIAGVAQRGAAVVLTSHVHTEDVDTELGVRRLMLPALRDDSDREWAHDRAG
jgi:ABC-type multidrug transport system ATPase subunit